MRIVGITAGHAQEPRETMTQPLHINWPWLLMTLGLLAAPLTGVAADRAVVTSSSLGGGVDASLSSDGSLILERLVGEVSHRLLQSRWADGRVDESTVFTGGACEGDPGGRRGFAATADDDGDGLIDEDRLDGQDNDGDGLIDEDFAAVGHAMAVWHRQRAAGDRHLETHHWTYPTLRHLLALTVTQDGGGVTDPLHLHLLGEGVWQPVDAGCVDLGPGVTVFLAEFDRHWLGVVVLDPRSRPRAVERIRADNSDLALPLLDGRLDMVLVSGPSRLRVVQGLLAAKQVHDGMTDPVTGARVPWLPQPAPAQAPEGGTLLSREQGAFGVELCLSLDEGQELDLDPDQLWMNNGEPLPVAAITWQAETGEQHRLEWPRSAEAADPLCLLSGLLNRTEEAGTLVLSVSQALPEDCEELQGCRSDGRPLVFSVEPDPASMLADDSADDSPTSASLSRLAPGLVGNYPNPFRFTTTISYRVPATVGEAFDLDAPDAPDLEPTRIMPYSANPPQVMVSVFSLEGRAVATLHAGRQGPGVYEVNWSGNDEHGRSLPSGAYFCKLQIENWSVTKRLIFVR